MFPVDENRALGCFGDPNATASPPRPLGRPVPGSSPGCCVTEEMARILKKKIAGPMLTLSDYGIWNFCFLVVFRDLEKLHSCCWPATRTTGSQSHVLCIKTPWKTALLPSSGSTAMSPTIFELYLTIAQYIQFQIGFTS